MIVYIAGPMTGVAEYNYPEFFRAEKELKEQGHIVLNPAWLPVGMTQNQYMWICLPMVDVCEKIYMLKGWESSYGASLEYQRTVEMGKIIEVQA